METRTFTNETFGSIRAVTIDGSTWFVGKDVAAALGFKNTKDALSRHVEEDDKQNGVGIPDARGREQKPVLINEIGLFSLLFSSRHPNKKEFKRWITQEVLAKNGVTKPTILVEIQSNQVVTTSRQIAETFEKGHNHVLRDILELQKDLSNFGQMFFEGTEPDSYGREQKIYYMNRDGFTLLAMGFTGKKAFDWKVKYIEAFNAMEKKLHEMPAQPIVREPRPTMTKEEYELRNKEADAERARLLREIADDVPVDTYKQVLNSYAAKALTGSMILPLPELAEKMYSPTDIANELGCTPNLVGKLISRIGNLRDNPEYSKRLWNKSQYSGREVVSYVYTRDAAQRIADEYQKYVEEQDLKEAQRRR